MLSSRAGILRVYGLAVDPAEHKLYYTNNVHNNVRVVDLVASTVHTIVNTTYLPRGLATDLQNR